MDEFNYLQYLNDDDPLLQAENQLFSGSFPTFSVDFDHYFGDTSLPSAEEAPCDPESRKTEPNDENTATPKAINEVEVSRFPLVSSDEILQLKSVAVNKNTSRSTKQWMNVFHSWAKSRHLENVGIETMSPGELNPIYTR